MILPEYNWQSYTRESLEAEIAKSPLTEKGVRSFLETRVKRVDFFESPQFQGEIQLYMTKFVIRIGLSGPQGEREISLVHEIVHGFYRAGGWCVLPRAEEKRMEAVIEKEALRFYRENKAFVKKEYTRMLTAAQEERIDSVPWSAIITKPI